MRLGRMCAWECVVGATLLERWHFFRMTELERSGVEPTPTESIWRGCDFPTRVAPPHRRDRPNLRNLLAAVALIPGLARDADLPRTSAYARKCGTVRA
jgi:hypothetical protein